MFGSLQLCDYANSLGSGYLKAGKAVSIVMVLQAQRQIVEDAERLNNYVTNSLRMEGFSDSAISKICEWIRQNNS